MPKSVALGIAALLSLGGSTTESLTRLKMDLKAAACLFGHVEAGHVASRFGSEIEEDGPYRIPHPVSVRISSTDGTCVSLGSATELSTPIDKDVAIFRDSNAFGTYYYIMVRIGENQYAGKVMSAYPEVDSRFRFL